MTGSSENLGTSLSAILSVSFRAKPAQNPGKPFSSEKAWEAYNAEYSILLSMYHMLCDLYLTCQTTT